MKAKFLVIPCGILALASACNNSSESKAKETDTATAMSTDTTTAMAKDTVMVTPAIDSAAVTREFLAAQKKTKKTAPPAPKKQGKNEVEIYSNSPIPAMKLWNTRRQRRLHQQPERVVHLNTKEYVYFIPSQDASYPGGARRFSSIYQKKYGIPGPSFAIPC